MAKNNRLNKLEKQIANAGGVDEIRRKAQLDDIVNGLLKDPEEFRQYYLEKVANQPKPQELRARVKWGLCHLAWMRLSGCF